MALDHLYHDDTGIDKRALGLVSELVAKASGRPVAANKSIVGEAVFTHESGLHVAGLLRDPRTYEGFDPAELGRRRRLVLGKHSGLSAVRHACHEIGLDVEPEQAASVLARVKDHALRTKQTPTSADLRRFIGETGLPH